MSIFEEVKTSVHSETTCRNSFFGGGRITKYNGVVASYAPNTGALALGLYLFAAFGGQAQAADECGADGVGADTITCSAGNYAGGGVFPNYPNGITYTGSDGLTLILNDPAITVTNPGVSVTGAVTSLSAINVIGTSFDTITTTSVSAFGLHARITNSASTATAMALLTDGDIETAEESAYGLYAQTEGLGATQAQMDGGSVTTEGDIAHGLHSRIINTASTATATALLTGGDIETAEESAYGLYAQTIGLGATQAQMDGGKVTTEGELAFGLISQIKISTSTATSSVLLTDGDVETTGIFAYGLYALTGGLGLASAMATGDSTVTAEGVNADGISTMISRAEATYEVVVSDTAVVKGGSGSGAGIHTQSVAGSTGTIGIAAGATVDGSTGLAGIVDDAGNTTMTINGTLKNGIAAGAGDDVANLNAGSVSTGGVAMGDGSDNVTIAAGADITGITLLDGGDDTLIADGFIDEITLVDQALSVPGTFLTNWEDVIVAGGSLTITNGALSVGIDTGHGLLVTNGGIVDAGGALALTGNLVTTAGGIFDGTGLGAGVYSISGTLQNNGIVTTQDGAAGDMITVAGNYDSQGGAFYLDSYLDDGSSGMSDRLAVAGNTSGSTQVFVNNDGGPGGITGRGATDGIMITDIGGSSDGQFELGARAYGGVFEYGLFQADGQDWYLQTTNLRDQGVMAPFVGYSLRTFGRQINGSYDERTSNRAGWQRGTVTDGLSSTSNADLVTDVPTPIVIEEIPSSRGGVWGRMIGNLSDADGSLLGGFNDVSYDETLWALQSGLDLVIGQQSSGTWIGSVFGHYGQIDTDSTNVTTGLSAGSVDTNGYGGGVSLTFEANSGFYLDGVATYTRYDLDEVASDGSFGSTHANGWVVSGEVGKEIALSDRFSMTPQVQLIWQSINIDAFIDSSGVNTSFSNADSLEGRLGSTLAYMVNPNTRIYTRANIVHEFMDSPVATVAGTPLTLGLDDSGYVVGGGAQWSNTAATMALWAEGDYRAAFNNDGVNTWSAVGGVALKF